MSEIKRIEVDEFWADSTIIEAGDFVFVGYCMACINQCPKDAIEYGKGSVGKPRYKGPEAGKDKNARSAD